LCHIASIMQGEDKASRVLKGAEQLGVASSQITAYSDSIWDLPLLLAAGEAVAVRPDRKLRSIARQAEWNIL
jgi:putative phosphoserine phosphatase / 1-acylglycerol-3-phosphate O-acyltransferase